MIIDLYTYLMKGGKMLGTDRKYIFLKLTGGMIINLESDW